MKYILSIVLSMLCLASVAQEERMITDRPGFTNNPATTRDKWLQVETGISRQSEKYSAPYKDQIFDHPSVLIKYGIGHRFELRMITALSTRRDEAVNLTDVYTGIRTFQLGGKFNFLKQKKFRPGISLMGHYSFHKLESPGFRYDSIDGANLRLVFENAFSKCFFLGYSGGLEWRTFRYEAAFVYSVSPRVILGEDWLLFAEIYGYAWPKRTPHNTIDFGLAYYLNDNLKIDASAGFGLTKPAPDNVFSVGASFRFRTSKKAD